MNLEELRDYCLQKKGSNESFPFDDKTLVFKVLDKMFCAVNIENFTSINLKCDPELSIELRERYTAVVPGYHMNKDHWNTVHVQQDAMDKEIFEWIDISYNLVASKLTKKQKEVLNQ